MEYKRYLVYILTNHNKTVLYVGITNNLPQRITEHYIDQESKSTFAGKYKCCYLLHYEVYPGAADTIAREKEIKGWSRKKKELLIASSNVAWKFLNDEIMEWPPDINSAKRNEW